MILTIELWERIRQRFTEAEKAAIRKAVEGEAICPRGWSINQDRLDPVLRHKLTAAARLTQ